MFCVGGGRRVASTGRAASASTGRAAKEKDDWTLEPGGTSCVGEDWGRVEDEARLPIGEMRRTTASASAKIGEMRRTSADCRLGKTKHDCSWRHWRGPWIYRLQPMSQMI
ncbi:hypothetical protein U1Q18_003793 [Sarracenia purpurea var. burkii]